MTQKYSKKLQPALGDRIGYFEDGFLLEAFIVRDVIFDGSTLEVEYIPRHKKPGPITRNIPLSNGMVSFVDTDKKGLMLIVRGAL